MCRHTNYPSPGPHTGTLQWLKLLQHAAFSVMKHEPGARARLSRGRNPSPPTLQPHALQEALPDLSQLLLAVTQDRDQGLWHPGVALTYPWHPHPAAPSARPLCIFGTPQAWDGRRATKWFGFVGVFFLFFCTDAYSVRKSKVKSHLHSYCFPCRTKYTP